MRFVTTVGDQSLIITLEDNGHLRQVTVGETTLSANWQKLGPGAASDEVAQRYSLMVGDQSYDLFVRRVPAREGEISSIYEVSVGSSTVEVVVQDEHTRALVSLAGGGHHSGDAIIRAPMPGLVSNVLAAVGGQVTRGQAVVVLEAMKMENDLTTPRAGVVKSIRVTKGQAVNQGEILVVVGDEGETPGEDESQN